MTAFRGPDKGERYWDEDYGDLEFLACIMECGTQTQFVEGDPLGDYWVLVDTWFKRMYPERWGKGENPTQSDVHGGQMGFKIALFHWFYQHGGTPKVVKSW